MKQNLSLVCALVLFVPASAPAGDKGKGLPALSEQHVNASETVRFRTPGGWTVHKGTSMPEVTEARGDGLVLRVIRREREVGLDALHVDCMLVRLASEKLSRPNVDYEYDFVSGALGTRRAVDSAFVVRYDEPIDGTRDWHQRNVSVVGEGESVCVIGYGPASATRKRSKPLRRLLDAVMTSVEFRPWR
jgi:hypothetical protein